MAERFTVNGFKPGLDKRRSELTSVVGSLEVLNNAHINKGGEIEKRRAFFPLIDQWFMRHGQTYGLNSQKEGLATFGSSATPTVATVGGDNTGMGYQLMATTNYLASTITAVPFAINLGVWVQVSLTDSSSRVITITNNSTSASGTVSTLISVTSGGDTNGSTNVKVAFTGTWAVGDIVSLSCAITAGPTTVLTFVVAAMPAAAFTTSTIAAQLAAKIQSTWPGNTGINVSVAANVISVTGTPITIANAGSVTAAGTLVVAGSGTGTATITVGGTWLSSDLASLKCVAAGTDVRFPAIVIKYATYNFTSFNLSAGAGKTPPITYLRLNPPTLGLTSPTLSQIVESCTFAGKTFAIAKFSDGYYYLYNDAAVVPDSFVGYVYSYLVNATDTITRANILKQWGYTNAGSILAVDPGLAAADTLTFYQARGPAAIATITVTSFSTSTGTASTGAGNTVVLAGQWAAGDWIRIVIVDTLGNSYQYGYGNVTALQAPVWCFPYKNKVYVLDNTNGGLLDFSAVSDAGVFNDPEVTGTGQIGLGQNSTVSDDVITASPYQGFYAIYFRQAVQIWNLNDDPTLNQLTQVLDNTGAVSQRAVVPIGLLDVIAVADSGAYSLRARDASNNALVVDIGSAINEEIVSALRALLTAPGTITATIVACFEPTENRFIFAIQNSSNVVTMWALSYYPESQVTAWATYDYISYLLPNGNTASNLIEKGLIWKKALYIRGGIFVGNFTLDGLTVYDPSLILRTSYANGFDASQASWETGWNDIKHPELVKDSEAVDVAMKGWWQIELGMDPQGTTETQIAVPYATAQPTPDTAVDSTFGKGGYGIRLRGTHAKFKGYTKPGYTGSAKVGAITVIDQYEDQK